KTGAGQFVEFGADRLAVAAGDCGRSETSRTALAAQNLTADQGKFAEAIPEYQRALELDNDLADAHYRLAQAYVRTGQKDKAQEQFTVYQQLRERHLADLDKQRADIRQFVYNEKEPTRP